ncbi:hypothetical protein UFOVP384_48 [uncultured Caudovirales phage]|uniref:Uncharacterized protein n=1 Tax=uncultured Caudovirales phage TaxID=2100421 RepID=A0A6J7WZI6_9CAUD|nr:hypothetical protein UFOVP384_48 [uncultured Caudovirales phage]
MEKKTAIKILKNSLIELSKNMQSIPIEGLMISMDYLESIEKDQIIEAYNEAMYETYLDGKEYYNERFGV